MSIFLETETSEHEEERIVFETPTPPPEHAPVQIFRPRPITATLGICGCDQYSNPIPLPGMRSHTPCNGELHDQTVMNIYTEFCHNHGLDHWFLCSPEGVI